MTNRQTHKSPFVAIAAIVLLWAASNTSRAQTIYVANENATLDAFNIGTWAPLPGFTSINVGDLSTVFGITVSGGDLYVASTVSSSGTATIGVYNAATGAFIDSFSVLPRYAAPGGIAVSGNVLYVANYKPGNSNVLAYNATTGVPIAGFTPPAGLTQPEGLAISGSDLYVADLNNAVYEYNAVTGARIAAFNSPTGLDGPEEIVISGNDLYVANTFSGEVGEYDATTGAAIAEFTPVTGLTMPVGVAISGTDLFVSSQGAYPNYQGLIEHYNATTGASLGIRSTGQEYPQYLAIAPVPEPGAWALIAGGLGLLFGKQRLRGARQIKLW